MTADDMKAMYRDFCRMSLIIRRSTAGVSTDYPVQGYFRLYSGKELVGTIVQGDLQVIVLYDDLVAGNFPLPITAADRVLAGEIRERRVQAPIIERRAENSEMVAYELQARG